MNGGRHQLNNHRCPAEIPKEETMARVLTQANTAYSRAHEIKKFLEENYIQTEVDAVDFPAPEGLIIEEIPKEYGKPLPNHYLQEVTYQETLITAYKALRKLNGSLSKLAKDDNLKRSVLQQLKELQDHLKLVLTEIEDSIKEHEFGDLSNEELKANDQNRSKEQNVLWTAFISKESINVLEYLRDSLNYLTENNKI